MLKAYEERALRNSQLLVEGGEDIFRFYLLPEPFSELPKVTTCILKTRSTLSVHRVYRYLAKRLLFDRGNDQNNNEASDEQVANLNVEIHCKGHILPLGMKLMHVYAQYAAGEELLTLYYRKKD